MRTVDAASTSQVNQRYNQYTNNNTRIFTMRIIPVLLFLALIVPVAASASDGTAASTTAGGSSKQEESKIVERDQDRDIFDLYDFFLPHFPTTFLDRGIFGFDSDLFRRTSPRYDIQYNPDNVEVTVEVPGFTSDDIEVEVKSGGRVLSISAQKESRDDERAFSSQFQQSFTLDPGVETEQFTANLSNGILTLTAPRHKALPSTRKIPITHLDQKMLDEMASEKEYVSAEKE